MNQELYQAQQRRYRTSEKGRASAAARQRRYVEKRRAMESPPEPVHRHRLFPIEALPPRVANFPAEFARIYAQRHGYHHDAYWQLLNNARRRGGFARDGAEHVAIAAGVNPASIWPDEWFAEMEEIA